MTTVDDLVSWLRQQLREDEVLAQKPISEQIPAERWGVTYRLPGDMDLICREASSRAVGAIEAGFANHVARWDPARVLAEVEAKRALIDYCYPTRIPALEAVAYTVVLHLAQPFADRPGFRDEWRLT